jgi:hypothetical protein
MQAALHVRFKGRWVVDGSAFELSTFGRLADASQIISNWRRMRKKKRDHLTTYLESKSVTKWLSARN